MSSQVPFSCDGQILFTLEPDDNEIQHLSSVVINFFTGEAEFEEINDRVRFRLNGIGYRKADDFVYGIQPYSMQVGGNHNFYRLGAFGNIEILASLDLMDDYQFFGGDVSPDSKYYVAAGFEKPSFGRPSVLVIVDLEDPFFSFREVLMEEPFTLFDIAFDPISGELYGYDSNSRKLLRIDVNNGSVIFESPIQGINQVVGLFFDAFGSLFAYGGETDVSDGIYLVNKDSGLFTLFRKGEKTINGDATSCPFIVDMIKTVEPREAVPCSEVIYTFEIANGTGATLPNVAFSDKFPRGFTILDVLKNEFNGLVSFPRQNEIIISGMELPFGVHKLDLLVEVGPVVPATYYNQATITNLPQNFGVTQVSDDPMTAAEDDSTHILILGVPQDRDTIDTQICEGEATKLDGSRYGNMNTWSTGETTRDINISTEGTYSLQGVFGCDTTYVEFNVTTSDIQVELPGLVFEIREGDTIFLEPSHFFNTSSITNVNWVSTINANFNCDTCLITFARPEESGKLLLQVSNDFGCTDEATITVEVSELRIFGPDIFTPNGDGINDFFYLQSPDLVQLVNLYIYNRWGDVVFSTKNSSHINNKILGWNGMINNNHVNVAVFVWIAEIRNDFGKTRFRYGDITLLRNRP